jgi:hypothetical protein
MTFWTQKSGANFKIEVGPCLKFIGSQGFCKLKLSENSQPILVKVTDNIVKKVTSDEIRDYCWKYLNEYEFKENAAAQLKAIQEEFYKSFIFTERNIFLVKETTINFLRDTKENAFLFFKNICLEVTADSIKQKSYKELDGHIWQEQIRPYNYSGKLDTNNIKGDFFEFLKDIAPKPLSGNDPELNFKSLKSIIGFLLHNFKDLTNAKCVILYDSVINGKPNGGSGKGLLLQGLEKIVETAVEDGKILKLNSQFPFPKVYPGTRLLAIDDAKEGFPFEKLFSAITGQLTVERKYENSISIPFDISPKIMITSNYIIPGEGASHRRRRIEYTISETYTDEFRPDVKFGRTFFDEWKVDDWNDFFDTMISCIQDFLSNGVIMQNYNLKLRQLQQEASPDFIEYAEKKINVSVKYSKYEKYQDFLMEYPNHLKIAQNTFTKWVELFAEANGSKFNKSHSGEINYFELTK